MFISPCLFNSVDHQRWQYATPFSRQSAFHPAALSASAYLLPLNLLICELLGVASRYRVTSISQSHKVFDGCTCRRVDVRCATKVSACLTRNSRGHEHGNVDGKLGRPLIPRKIRQERVQFWSEDLRERVLELTAGRGVDAVFNTVGGPTFEPALQSLRHGGRQVVISSPGDPRVSFNLIDFYHNLSRLLGVDGYGLTLEQVAEIEDGLQSGFEIGPLKPPAIEIVPFEKAVEAYGRVAARQAKAKLVLSFE
jgi:hypothetical protein